MVYFFFDHHIILDFVVYVFLSLSTFLDVFCSRVLLLPELDCTEWDLSECYRPVASYRALVEVLWENCTQYSRLHSHLLRAGILRMSVSGQSRINSCLWEIGEGLIGELNTCYCLEALKKRSRFVTSYKLFNISDN